jgi:hypothetical protein
VARELQQSERITLMAAKVMMLKLLQEMRGFAELAQRRPQPRPTGLVLMQLRSQFTHTRLPPCKRSIAVDMKDLTDIPHPVRITHLGTNPTQPKGK